MASRFTGEHIFPRGCYGRPSFKRVLLSIAQAYHEKNADVIEQATMVESAIAHAESLRGEGAEFSPRSLTPSSNQR